ncbi:hypothetical protein Q5P01_022442 [Channa striata]|uniref:Zona pellucida sperm-binding protein 3 n=1 Tax=Channa striata TaxID=64152 RepID=A0AA88JCU2_CHASR|nr:hypothetical protein Q5P01_022442 [Channa striata]
MGRDWRKASAWWIIALIISAFTAQLVSGGTNSPRGTFGKIRTEASPVRQLEPAGLSARPRPVVVRCNPDSMEVVVQADMFGSGLEVDSRHLRLGSHSDVEGVACGAFPSGEAEFTIRAPLMDCGSKRSSTEERIVYSNVLVYAPEPSSEGLLRLDGAAVPVECHYEKKCAVTGLSLQPALVPLVSRVAVEDQIDFNLRLINDHWHFERGSYTYFLGDPIYFEASAILANHMPLRLYVDQCVATATPDAEAALRYDFIENYGCLADAYLTNSSSHFIPRAEEHKLKFKLDAFRFYQETSNQIYITCYMKVVPVTLTVSSQNRACSLTEKRWRSVDGNDQACRSCNVSSQVEEPRTTEAPKTTMMPKESAMTSEESLVQKRPEQDPVKYVQLRPGMYQSQFSKVPQSHVGLPKTEAEYTAKRTTQLGPLAVLAGEFVSPPTDSKAILRPMNKIT